MKLLYYTNRLILQVLSSGDAPMVLDFYERNRKVFEPWEPFHSAFFYTLEHHAFHLEADMKLFLRKQSIRYYLFERKNDKGIIGTVSFTNILSRPAGSCSIGYRIDEGWQQKGYAAEALLFLIPTVMRELSISRIEANIMPANTASIRLAESLGFVYEGIARGSYEIRGSRTDHLRYSLLDSDILSRS